MYIKRICAWCNKEFGIADARMSTVDKISHGICHACYEIQIKELEASGPPAQETRLL